MLKNYGNIVDFKLLKGKDGLNIGSGFVTYESISLAAFALSKLDNTI